MRTCLYIKPVIPGVTVLDSNAYGKIMENNKIDAIVGEHFSSNESSILSPISSRLYVTEHSDVVLLRENLSAFGKVFINSTEHLLAKQDDVC